MGAAGRRLAAWAQAHPERTLLALGCACLLIFLASIPLPHADSMLIGSDGVGYYMVVRSLVLDGNLDFSNEFARLYPQEPARAVRSPTGLTVNPYAVGTGLLWLPFFGAAHLAILGLTRLGLPYAADGYGYPYQAAVCIGSIVYGIGGMLLMYRALRRMFPRAALATCLLTWLASNYIYYLVAEPSMSHMCSFFAAALLMNFWLAVRPAFSLRSCFLLGLCGGLVGIVRQPDALLLLMPAADILLSPSTRRKWLCLVLMAAGFFCLFWVQMAAWRIVNGGWLTSGYLLSGKVWFNWLKPRLLDVWFSTWHGLFIWHPILLAGAAGIVQMIARRCRLGTLLALGLMGQSYVIAAWSVWWQGDSFGGRMFIASLPLLMIGMASLLDTLQLKSTLRRIAAVAGLLLIVWNALALIQYRLGFISMSGPYTWRELTIGRFEMLAELVRRLTGP